MGKPPLGNNTGTLERVPVLCLCLERKTGFEPATLTLAKISASVHRVHELPFRAPASTFRPPNTPQSTWNVDRST